MKSIVNKILKEAIWAFPFKEGDRVEMTNPSTGEKIQATIFTYKGMPGYPNGFGYKNDKGGVSTGINSSEIDYLKMKKI